MIPIKEKKDDNRLGKNDYRSERPELVSPLISFFSITLLHFYSLVSPYKDSFIIFHLWLENRISYARSLLITHSNIFCTIIYKLETKMLLPVDQYNQRRVALDRQIDQNNYSTTQRGRLTDRELARFLCAFLFACLVVRFGEGPHLGDPSSFFPIFFPPERVSSSLLLFSRFSSLASVVSS